jgi:UDP-glucose 4-epimerase
VTREIPDIKGARVLVTGGAGFIGSHMVDALLARGAHVVVVDNLLTGRRENLNPQATFYEMNLADPAISEVMERERPDIVYHLAFYVLVPKSVEDPLLDMDILAGTIHLLQGAKRFGVGRMIIGSSGFVYGNAATLPCTEECPIDPVSPYVVSKHAVENYTRFYHRAYGLPYVILRYAAIYGPRQRTGAMADYIRKLASDQQAEMWGDGTKTRDYVFIEDVVDANLKALGVPGNLPNPVFNIGTGVETTLNDLYARIARILGKEPKPIYYPDRAGEQFRYSLDITKARRELGWQPRYSLGDGLRVTVAAHLGR